MKTKINSVFALVLLVFLTTAMQISAQNTVVTPLGSATNSFFDNDSLHPLIFTEISINGEILNPMKLRLANLPLHSVLVKETRLSKSGKIEFVGAYKYVGYSLSEILDAAVLQKKNAEAFPPLTDIFVEIENQKGEKVVLSWGELYYPNNMHTILLATHVMRVVPEKTKEQWPLPTECKIVVGSDLVAARNISSPTSIRVRTFEKEMEIEKGKFPMNAEEVTVSLNGKTIETLKQAPAGYKPLSLHTIFYGKGRGLHSTQPFTGFGMNEYIKDKIEFTEENLKTALVLFAADDGYRAVFTLSELCNRCDQQQTLLLYDPSQKGKGSFRIYPSSDFFSDRSVKGLIMIWIVSNN